MKTDKELIVQTWVSHGIKDFFISFEFEDANKWHEYSTLFCSQGLEKICKAYLIASEIASKQKEYGKLPKKQALDKINKIAKDLGHDLRALMGRLCLKNVFSITVTAKKIEGYTGDELVDILEKAYIESRYPTPNPIHKKYPINGKSKYKMYYDPISSTAPIKYSRNIAVAVLRKIESDFLITISKDKFSGKIADKDWARFCKMFFEISDPG